MINLSTYKLEEYDLKNIDHKSTLINLFNDKDTFKYMGNILSFTESIITSTDDISNIYIAYLDQKPVGFVSIYFLGEKYEICYAILPSERNKNIASTLLGEFTDFIFRNYPIDDLYLYINRENESSIKVAIKNDYVQNGIVEYKKSGR